MKFRTLLLVGVSVLLFGCGGPELEGLEVRLGQDHLFLVEEAELIEDLALVKFEPGLDGFAFEYEDEMFVLTPEEMLFFGMINKNRLDFLALVSHLKERGLILTINEVKLRDVWQVRGTSSFEGEELFRGHRIFENLEEEELLSALNSGGNYLVAVLDEDGRFIYDYDPVEDEVSDQYNILRHAGTTYSMLELYAFNGDENVLKGAERALEYLSEQIETCGQGSLCVVEDGNVKVGGNALAILAFVEYGRVSGDWRYLEEARGLAHWITSVQQEDGRFEPHKYDLRREKADDFVSEYYPGEAIFALSRLGVAADEPAWLDVAEKNALYLIEVRDAGKEIEELIHDHWLLYGLNELYRERPREEFLRHTERTAKAIVDAQHHGMTGDNRDWNGGYYRPPRSTPTATRSEGLVAAYKLLRDYSEQRREDEPDLNEIMVAIEEGVKFQLSTQFGPESKLFFDGEVKAEGGFHESLTDFAVRIDYVQHNLSAILGYMELD